MKRVLFWMWVAGELMLAALVALVVLPGFILTVAANVVKPDAAKGEQLYTNGDATRGIIACVTCHGPGGNSAMAANPNLAAQPHEYLAKQLMDFQVKGGAKLPARNGIGGTPTMMTANVAQLSEQDIQNMALYLSQQPLQERATASQKAWVELGQKIWRGGLPDRQVPACASCHSATGSGIPAQYPRLSGQFPAYLEAQLRLFRQGDRNNNAPMNAIAARLSDAEIQAVADFAAGLR
jgi:cytochrome c553